MTNPFGLQTLRTAYDEGRLTVTGMVEALLAKLADRGDDPVWISRVPDITLLARAAELDALPPERRGPLFGIPFAAKDNIDAAALPTTAACPAFAYQPAKDATVVACALAAGAVLVGKTNLDQFATGLVGVRSPYGIPKNALDERMVPGGSSSGSAVAVASGLVGFAFGTDTAGSGRVPAAFNGIVGLKPSKGLLSTSGVVPACRTLDCVSVFAETVADAVATFEALDAFDPADPYARTDRVQAGPLPPRFRFGIPQDVVDCGDATTKPMFAKAVEALRALGGEPVPLPFALFQEAAALLYDGPWLAERAAGVGDFILANPDEVHPVTKAIVQGAARFSAMDAFRAQYRMAEIKRETELLFETIDLLAVPSAPTIYTVEQVLADPVQLNSNLGTYTNFVNLLDMAALAIPAGTRPDGLPFGITLIGPALSDRRLGALGQRLLAEAPTVAGSDRIVFAVVGAHLSGMALNGELKALGGAMVGPVKTAACYKMYLVEGKVPRPGLMRVPEGGAALEAELWSLSDAGFGRFVAGIAAPLGIGTLELENGSAVKGFICEAVGVGGARDITAHGGWRNFLAAGA